MGTLYKFNIRDLIIKYNLSVEYYEKYYKHCQGRFKGMDKVNLYLGKSDEKIPEMLTKVSKDEKILFWLDAHLLSNYQLALFGTLDEDTEFPLEKELKAIVESRDVSGDYFIIDDPRIYSDETFAAGSCPEKYKSKTRGIQFIYDLFEKTHNISKDYRNEGYVIMEPKNG